MHLGIRPSFLKGVTALLLAAGAACWATGATTPASAPPSASPIAALPRWADLTGRSYGPADVARSRATVFLFVSTQCPIANLYSPRLAALGRAYAARGVRFFLVDSNAEDAATKVRRYARERAIPFPAVKDRGTQLADALGAATTPEAVILDPRGIVVYRGRIDDSADRSKVSRQDAREALDAVLAGRPIAHPRTLAFGCAIFHDTARVAAAPGSVTYAHDVAAILDRNCVSCHRAGEVAPFSLETYPEARTWAAAIKDYTARRVMPPWKAAPGVGDFRGAPHLTDRDIATLARWADSGAPLGNAKAIPPLPHFPPAGQWRLGTPDLVLRAPRPYHLGAEGVNGKDVYREYVLPLDLPNDMYLSAVDFKQDNRAIVHHMIAYLDPTGKAAALDGHEAEPGYTVPGTGIGTDGSVFIAGWAPGNTPRFLPAGTAYRLTKGAKLVLQVHYHPDGKPEADRSAIGLHFAKYPVNQEMRVWASQNDQFDLKPGVADQAVTADWTLPADVHVWAVLPHMHMLGRKMAMTAYLPDGTVRPMIAINDWDFNWQESYDYRTPLALPKGTRIHVDAVYDNSETNPRQPSQPPREVRFGEQTIDEMCIGFFTVTVDGEKLGVPAGKTAGNNASL